jgi:hypothetical protein
MLKVQIELLGNGRLTSEELQGHAFVLLSLGILSDLLQISK